MAGPDTVSVWHCFVYFLNLSVKTGWDADLIRTPCYRTGRRLHRATLSISTTSAPLISSSFNACIIKLKSTCEGWHNQQQKPWGIRLGSLRGQRGSGVTSLTAGRTVYSSEIAFIDFSPSSRNMLPRIHLESWAVQKSCTQRFPAYRNAGRCHMSASVRAVCHRVLWCASRTARAPWSFRVSVRWLVCCCMRMHALGSPLFSVYVILVHWCHPNPSSCWPWANGQMINYIHNGIKINFVFEKTEYVQELQLLESSLLK